VGGQGEAADPGGLCGGGGRLRGGGGGSVCSWGGDGLASRVRIVGRAGARSGKYGFKIGVSAVGLGSGVDRCWGWEGRKEGVSGRGGRGKRQTEPGEAW